MTLFNGGRPWRSVVASRIAARALAPLTGALLLTGLGRPAPAQVMQFLDYPLGYEAGSVDLPLPYGGGLGAVPSNPDKIYVAVGSYGDMKLARIDLGTTESLVVADGPFGSLGGVAPISLTEVVLIDNAAAPGGPPDRTILIARDNNPADGDFNDPGEITELIAPILTGFFSGAQARIVPPGDPSGLPSGSVMLQTADGAGGGELLAIINPLTTPTYRPAGSAYYNGFDYNGGFDFDSYGHIWMGDANSSFVGSITALVNMDNDESIGVGEFSVAVTNENGMADLVIDAEDDVFFGAPDPNFTVAVRTFRAPASPLGQSIAPVNFATTDASFLSGLLINTKSRPFAPGAPGPRATLLVGGFDATFSASTNLLTLSPAPPSAVRDWELYGDEVTP